MGIAEGSRILDVACGTGALSRAVARRAGAPGLVSAIDMSGPMLDVARAKRAEVGAAMIAYREESAEDLRAREASFDIVVCQQGLQFFADPVSALRKMRYVVKPGGRVAVTTWSSPDPESVWTAVINALDRYIGKDAGDEMRSPFSLHETEELSRLFTKAGFKRIELTQRTLTVRSAPREGFARNYLLATPLGQRFLETRRSSSRIRSSRTSTQRPIAATVASARSHTR